MRKMPPRKFVTPFKPGMRPGEPGHAQLKVGYDAERVDTISGPNIDDAQSKSDLTRKSTGRRFFDLSTLRHLFGSKPDTQQGPYVKGRR